MLQSFIISPEIFPKIPDINKMPDEKLPEFLVRNESRQLIHITYGGLLNDPEIRDEFFKLMDEHEENHYQLIEKHFGQHLELLGLPKAD